MMRWLRDLTARPTAQMAILIVGYVALAAWGEQIALSETLTLWYPPPGLAVAAVVLGGRRFAVPTILAELVVSLVVFDVAGSFGVGLTLLNAVLVGGSYVAVGATIRRLPIDLRVCSMVDIGLLVSVLVVGAVPAAVAGSTIQRAAGVLDDGHFDAVLTWFQGDALGMLSVTPAILLVVAQRHRSAALVPRPRLWSGLGALEIASVLLVPVVVVSVADRIDALYLSLAPVVFVALRRAHPGSAVAAGATTAAVTTMLGITGDGFSRSDVLALLVVIAVTGLIMGLVVAELFQSTHTNQRLTAALERTDDLVAMASLSGEPRWWNRAAGRFLQRAVDGTATPLHEVLVGGADRAEQLALHVADGLSWEGNQDLLTPDGEEVPVSLVVIPDVDDRDEVVGYTLFARDVTAQRRYEAELSRRALFDELTGVPNRTLLLERLDHARGRLRRSGRQSVLMLLDVDRFKIVNDSLGHPSGDELLRTMAERLSCRLRAGDTLARIGGDEFAVLAEDLDGMGAILAVADGVLASLQDPFPLRSGTVVATASLGIVRIDPDETPDELMRCADLAMYRAKAEGGCRYAIYDDRMTRSADRRLQLESALRRTIADGHVPMHFQPVVDLRTGKMRFAEALLRVDYPELGKISPPEIIAIARETGLLTDLSRITTRTAVRAAARWSPSSMVSVNVSPSQLADDQLPDILAGIVDSEGFDPNRLIVEITEEAFLEDPDHAADVLRRCKRLGIHVALDDFGTGWSSLATLRTLPIDILKLDQELLSGLGASPQARAIVGAVLGVAEVLELTVVAEGIETEDQLEISRSLGCDLGQGYRIARPAPTEDLTAWVGVAQAVVEPGSGRR